MDFADDTTLLLLTVARQPVNYTRFPIKQLTMLSACTATKLSARTGTNVVWLEIKVIMSFSQHV
jgi:hypothetical protein